MTYGPDPYAETVRLLPADTFTHAHWEPGEAEQPGDALTSWRAQVMADPDARAVYKETLARAADTFTEQTREEWVQVVAKALWESIGVPYIGPSRAVVDALLAHLAARPTFGAHNR